MIATLRIRICAALFCLALPLSAWAQGEAIPLPDAAVLEDGATNAVETQTDPFDPAAFDRLARRAEDLAASETASPFAIGRLRAELVVWRDHFLAKSRQNAGRLATLNAQIAALGPVPENGQEPQQVADRRADLVEQRNDLIAPRLLAQEAYVRAEGLIREFDARALQRDTAALVQRGPVPFGLSAMHEAVGGIGGLVRIVSTEVTGRIRTGLAAGTLLQVLPQAILLFAVGIGLLSFGRSMVTRWRGRLSEMQGRWVPLLRFFVSFAQIIVPLIGLTIATQALELLGIFGLRGTDIVDAIPSAGFCAIFGWWLSRQIFPQGAEAGYLRYDPAVRARGRIYVMAIGWIAAVVVLVSAGLRTIDLSEAARAVAQWPVLVVTGLCLWRLGRLIRTPPMPTPEDAPSSGGRSRLLVGRFCIAVALVAPTIAAFGFGFAGRSLLVSSILSLSLAAVLYLMQRIIQDLLERPSEDEDNRGIYALLPVFVTFALFVISAPFFALIWGARVEDLLEIWTRFREGFAIGETRLSPTDFLMFVFVFALGYLLTRFVQGLLRRSVLPRTRLDLGAQNALVAGLGYVGIILASVFAITTAGLDLSNLAIVAGALSVGIGFGLQTIVSNFVSGIILLIERPVSEGDWIEVGGQMGVVRSISVRSTRIETFDRRDVIVPNADLVSGQVTNWTRNNWAGRIIVPVGVAYGTDTEKVARILQEIAEAHPVVQKMPPPNIHFAGFGADSLDFEIRAILNDVNFVISAKSDINHAIAKRFAEEGIEIPFAQRDIWLRNPEALKG
ncbi:mechanosensitive ion channel domain-containing protein [Yoonia sp.]|uniref:mechanosensitive ion channel domain-containing protein n=1 Tax=Yoonia sp. TaxID=2212373 RepID=UPI002FDAAA8E